MSDENIRYAVFRRVGDFDEYLQVDGDFGPLTDPRLVMDRSTKAAVTRVFFEEDQAEVFVESWEKKHPTVALFVSLEVRRLP